MRRPIVLIVDDEPSVRETLEIILGDYYETVLVSNGLEAVEIVKSVPVDLVLLDINLPHVDGFKTLGMIKKQNPDIGVVMLSAIDSAQKAVYALNMGAYDYLTKPFETEDLLSTIKRYTDGLTLKREIAFLREELHSRLGYGDIISKSPKMQAVFDLVKKVSKASASVLITGESGTGKELIARAIHELSDRKERPFVAINCGAVPANLMESELFGYEKGAFTGANTTKIGKFEFAEGGTIFLDEIGNLHLHLQAKLLRVLQEMTVERVGGNQQIDVDVRIIAATNIDVEQAVRDGKFREDLYYRLKVVPIELPALRQRKEDIPLLVDYFFDRLCKKSNKSLKGIANAALRAFSDYSWPGNVRELENLIERLVVLAKDGSEIAYSDIPVDITAKGKGKKPSAYDIGDYKEACKAFEKNYIIGVLNRTGWNRSEAASLMNVHRNTLLHKMKDLSIDSSPYSRRNPPIV
jgi:DNA-binding NtrC family response regulator